MSITITLQPDDPRIIHIAFRDPWNWEQFFAVFGRLDAVYGTLDEAYLIVDFSKSSHYPPGVVEAGKKMSGRMSDVPRIVAFVGMTDLQQVLLQVFGALMPKQGHKYVTAESMEEARSLVTEKMAQLA